MLQILDSLALHLPPEKIVSQVVKNASLALNSAKPSERKAGYVALGIIAEGCSEHITSKYVLFACSSGYSCMLKYTS